MEASITFGFTMADNSIDLSESAILEPAEEAIPALRAIYGKVPAGFDPVNGNPLPERDLTDEEIVKKFAAECSTLLSRYMIEARRRQSVADAEAALEAQNTTAPIKVVAAT